MFNQRCLADILTKPLLKESYLEMVRALAAVDRKNLSNESWAAKDLE